MGLMNKAERLERYRWLYAGFREGWQHATARYEAWAQSCLSSEARVLDLGCGRGGIVERLYEVGKWIGGDPDWHSLKEHRVPMLPRCQMNAERLPYADGVFSLILASWVLEHIEHPAEFFGEVARVLRPGGAFIFLTPNALHPIPRLSRFLARRAHLQRRWAWWQSKRSPEDAFPVFYQANTISTIQQIAANSGLALVQLELVDDPSYFVWGRLAYSLAVGLELSLPGIWRVHIVGWYTKPRWS